MEMAEKREIRSLTGLRGVCAIWVVMFHAFFAAPFYGTPLDWLVCAGYMGVDVFFALSGFVLAHNYANTAWTPRSYLSFLRKRFARIYPAHAFTLVVFVVVVWLMAQIGIAWMSPAYTQPIDLLKSFLLIHAWEPTLNFFPWNGPSWTISAEWAAYMAFPLVAWAVMRIRSATSLVAFVVLLYVLYAVAATQPGLDLGAARRIPPLASSFCAGVLLWRLASITPSTPLDGKAAGFFLMLLLLGAGASDMLAMKPVAGYRFAIVAAAVVYFVARSDGAVARFLSTPTMNYLGRISYSLYLVHILFMYLSDLLIARSSSPWSIRIAAIILAGLAAHCLYTWVEEPCRKAIARSRAPAPAPALDAAWRATTATATARGRRAG